MELAATLVYDAMLQKKRTECHVAMVEAAKKLLECRNDVEDSIARLRDIADDAAETRDDDVDEVARLLAEKRQELALLRRLRHQLQQRRLIMRVAHANTQCLDKTYMSLRNRQRHLIDRAFRRGLLHMSTS